MPAQRSEIEALQRTVSRQGWDVENAHAREGWGLEWMSPDVCTPLDFEAVTTADLLLAVPGCPPSGGVHIEIGWATASGVPVLLLLDERAEYSHLVRGLHTVARVHTIWYQSISVACTQLSEWLNDSAGAQVRAAEAG